MATNLTRRGASANLPARLPALPASTAPDPQRRAFEEMVREWLEVRLGARGDRWERAVTFRDLDPIINGLDRRITALENESAASVEDCCRELRAAIRAIWDAIYALRRELEDAITGGRGRDLEVLDDVNPRPDGDPYWENVILLVQGGVDADTTILDRSLYADTTTIVNYATWSSAEEVFGVNMIETTTIGAAVNAFTSTGSASRFGRATGDKLTIECWIDIVVVENYAPSCFLFSWRYPVSSSIFEVGLYGNTPHLRLRNGTDTSIETATIASGRHYLQMNIDGVNYTLDVDGVQVYAGTNSYSIGQTGDYEFQVASQNATGSGTGTSTRVYVSPLRVTKGVLRPRGSVPTSPFAEEAGGSTSGGPGNALFFSNSPNSDLTTPPLAIMACSPSAQSGICVVSAPNGVNTIEARTGKVYIEFEFQGADDMSYVGLLDNASISAGYPTTSDPFGFTGLYAMSNVTGGGHSPGLITNGTESTNALYDWTATLGGAAVGIAWDTTTGDVWFSIAGAWVTGNPATGTSPTFTLPDAEFTFVAGNFLASGTNSATTVLNARADRTQYSPPSGFTWYA